MTSEICLMQVNARWFDAGTNIEHKNGIGIFYPDCEFWYPNIGRDDGSQRPEEPLVDDSGCLQQDTVGLELQSFGMSFDPFTSNGLGALVEDIGWEYALDLGITENLQWLVDVAERQAKNTDWNAPNRLHDIKGLHFVVAVRVHYETSYDSYGTTEYDSWAEPLGIVDLDRIPELVEPGTQ